MSSLAPHERSLVASALALALGLAGCMVNAEGEPAQGGGGGGAAGPGGSGPGGDGPGGSGGGAACDGPEDCPAPGECLAATCSNGVCGVEASPLDTPCGDGTTEACDGSGACLGKQGHPCAGTTECLGLTCADGFCCDAACDTLCGSCGLSGSEGTCTPHPVATNPEGCAPGTCDGAGSCASGTPVSSGAIVGTADTYPFAVSVDTTGSAVIAGHFTGTTNAGGLALGSAGAHDIFVAKFDAAGAHVWSQRFGDNFDQYAFGVATWPTGESAIVGNLYGTVDFGGGPLPTTNTLDGYVVKLAADGSHAWSKRFGDNTNNQGLAAVAVAPNGDVVVGGDFFGGTDLGGGTLTSAGNSDVVVGRFGTMGNHLWSKRFGDASEQRLTGVAVDADGNVLVTGYFLGTVDFGGGGLGAVGSYDAFVVKLDPSGNHLWSKRYGDASDQRARAVAAGPDGVVAIGGGFIGTLDFGNGALTASGGYDAFVALLDDAGNAKWSRRFGDASEQQVYGVSIDENGNVVFGGDLVGSADFGGGSLSSFGGYDTFVAKLALDGTHLWSRRFGDASTQYGNAVATSPGGGWVWMTGYFFGTLDFGTGTQLVNTGGYDGYWARLLP